MDAHVTEARSDSDWLVRHDPNLPARKAIHLHREAHRRVQCPHALALQGRHDLAGDLIDVISGVVEFEVGDRTGRAADRLPVHATDEAEERPGRRKHTQDVVPLVIQGGAADLDQAGVIGPAVEAKLPQPRCIEGLRLVGGAGAFTLAFVEAPHGRMFGEVHDNASCSCICNYISKKTRGGSALGTRPAQLLGGFVEQGDSFTA